jgi:DNA-binding CsgD family transcriptional regulator
MAYDINKLQTFWNNSVRTAIHDTTIPHLNFEELVSAIISVGPFYFYVIDFFDRSISHVSPAIKDIHGFNPETVTLNDIINTIHPEDMDFVVNAEEANFNFLYQIIGKDNITDYKSNFSFRSRLKNGEYCLLNHQAIILTTDVNGCVGKSLNIHTNIDHITKKNSYNLSLIGLKNFPSYMDINVSFNSNNLISYTKREVEIIKCISKGCTNKKIAEHLQISIATVKTHRKNIHQKSGCKNAVELVNKSLLHGLI